VCSRASCWGTLSSNFHKQWALIHEATAISSTTSGKGLSNDILQLIVMEACSATFLTDGSLNWSISLDHCHHLVFFSSAGPDSASASEYCCWELGRLEWKVTRITALSLGLVLRWELTRPDAGIDRGSSTNCDPKEETDEDFVAAFGKNCVGGI